MEFSRDGRLNLLRIRSNVDSWSLLAYLLTYICSHNMKFDQYRNLGTDLSFSYVNHVKSRARVTVRKRFSLVSSSRIVKLALFYVKKILNGLRGKLSKINLGSKRAKMMLSFLIQMLVPCAHMN